MEDRELEKKDHWFVAQTIPHAELRMRKYFEDRGIECFVPTLVETRKKKGEMTETETPIIRNLIFFKADYTVANSVFSLNYRLIYRLRDSGGLLRVPEQRMSWFMRFINGNRGTVRILDSSHVAGERMRVRKGPLEGLVGKVACIDNSTCLTVSLDGLLAAAVKFPKSNLMRVEETEPETV